MPSPLLWGDVNTVRERLGTAVTDMTFERDVLGPPALSPPHVRELAERTSGQVINLIKSLSATDPQRLDTFRREYEAIVGEYLEDNVVRHDYLLTRATKV